MSTRTITLPDDQWAMILEAVEDHTDEGPYGAGWKSSRLSAASAALSTALAQSEPEGVTALSNRPIISAPKLSIFAVNQAAIEPAPGFDPRLVALATTSEQIPSGPYSEHELRTQWNAQADEFNQWESLDLSEQLAWAQARAIAADRARRGRPAIEPVPVAERPWERERWCDAEGRCWFGAPPDGAADAGWILRKPSERLSHQTVSLPHHVLPLPAPKGCETGTHPV